MQTYIPTHVTNRSEVLLEKPTVIQQTQDILDVLWNRKIQYRVRKSPPRGPRWLQFLPSLILFL
jgi:hypothetical protein